MSDATGSGMRTRALVGLGVAILISIAGRGWLSRAAQSGIERLAAIERARTECERAWSAARTNAETLTVDRIALKDTIDARSDAALRRCGDLRTKIGPPNAREMTGQPMPDGRR